MTRARLRAKTLDAPGGYVPFLEKRLEHELDNRVDEITMGCLVELLQEAQASPTKRLFEPSCTQPGDGGCPDAGSAAGACWPCWP